MSDRDDVLESVLAEQAARRKSAEAEFRKLARNLASGERPKPADVDRVLSAANKSVDDLRTAVERLRRRDSLQRQITEADAAEREAVKVQGQIDKAKDRLQRFETEVNAEIHPLEVKLQQLRDAITNAGSARRELFETSDDEGLRERLSSIRQQQAECELEKSRLVDVRDRVAVNIKRAQQDIDHGFADATREQQQSQARYRGIGEQLAALDERLQKLADDEQQLSRNMAAA